MKKTMALVLALCILWLPLPTLAGAIGAALQAQVDMLLAQFGFKDLDEALELNGVDAIEQLAVLALTGKLKTPTSEAASAVSTLPVEIEERTFDGKVLATMEMEASAEEIKYFFQEQLGIPIKDFLCFPTVNDAVLALKTGKVDTLLSMDSTATMMARLDPSLYTYMDPRLEGFANVALSMVVMKSNEALGKALNAAIAGLKANGILLQLAASMFGGQPPEAPVIEAAGAPLLVGVTGDIPPIDYVDATGNPVGYNINLMAQIGAILGRSIDFVQVNKAAAIMALATGRIDILFWQEQAVSDEIKALVGDLSQNVFITDPYLTMSVAAIELK